jgi:hypothetical protein
VRLLREWEESLSNSQSMTSTNTTSTTDTADTSSDVLSFSSDKQQHQQQPQETTTTAAAAATTTAAVAATKRRHQFVAVMSADLNDTAISVLAKGCDAYIPKPVSAYLQYLVDGGYAYKKLLRYVALVHWSDSGVCLVTAYYLRLYISGVFDASAA